MPYQVRTEAGGADGVAGPVVVLEESSGAARAAVTPPSGFNCYRWQVQHPTAGLLDLLYSDPQQFATGHPTRAGIPILFPFPNRIRDGRFRWDGGEYQLPVNDPAGKNAIHGFACRRPWRVTEQGADDRAAWVTAEFQGSVDAADARDLWPADYRIRVTYRLAARSLRVEALVENPDTRPLPFGLGYHPYVRIPFAAAGDGADYRVSVPAASFWELDQTLPTGRRRPVAERPGCDLTTPRRFETLQLDDVLTDLPAAPSGAAGVLWPRGSVTTPGGPEVALQTSAVFSEVVVFTPPHRQAVAVEPYTCVTDAINLEQQGVDAGLLVLQPGQSWSGVVELAIREPVAS
jgi:aldose 1-epimerase